MWREEDGRMVGQRICPFMSEPGGMVLCQGKHCAAACPRNRGGETYWFCEIIEGHGDRKGCRRGRCIHEGKGGKGSHPGSGCLANPEGP